VPEVGPVQPLESALRSAQEAKLRLLLDPDADSRLRDLGVKPGDSVALAAGPEAGFSEREADDLRRAGFSGVRLGPRVLRTETAALAALASLAALYGDG
jgi:16S rRNA (uracil1498-N3)-methyltransferase